MAGASALDAYEPACDRAVRFQGAAEVSAGRILDPGGGRWMLDATVVNNCAVGGVARQLVDALRGHVYLAERVDVEVRDGPYAARYTPFGNWYTVWPLMTGHREYERLVLRFSADPTKNRGEAESILIAQDNGLVFATDDGFAHAEAGRRGICTTRTPALLISLVRSSALSERDAWEAFDRMLRAGRRFGELPWTDHADFIRLCSVAGYEVCP